MSNFSLKILGLITILGLSACGGDDSTFVSSTPPKEEPPLVTSYVTIKGTAISRNILSNATVTARCKDDSGFKNIVKSNEKGEWEGQVKLDQLPCRLKAKNDIDGNLTHYSVIFDASNHINITPFTDLAIAIRKGYSYMPNVLYGAAGRDINYDVLRANLNNNNNLLVRVLIEKDYDISPSTQFFSETIDINGNIMENIKGIMIAADTNRNRGSFSDLIRAVHIGDYTVLIPNKVIYSNPVVLPDYHACAQGGADNTFHSCTAKVISDFDSTSLLSEKNNTSCRLKKEGGTFSFFANRISYISYYYDGDESLYDNTLEINKEGNYDLKINLMKFIFPIGPIYSKIELKVSKDGHITNMTVEGVDCKI